MVKKSEPNVLWSPTVKQSLFLTCPADEVFYGGAAGGGKTDALLMKAIGPADSGFFSKSSWRALILRRTFPELEKTLIARSLQILYGSAKYDHVKHRWTSPCGGIIQFGHVKTADDVFRHQGSEYNLIEFDELTHFTERMYTYMFSRLRTTDATLKCQVVSASNPGGIGHAWVKRRFIDEKKPLTIYKEILVMPDGKDHVTTRAYVPATVYDNSHLMQGDPGYIARLLQLPDVERRAYLNGDWDIFAGQFFPEFSEVHICDPFIIPENWPQWISMDYGFNTKCAIGFYTQDPDTDTYYRWGEIYATRTHPDELSKMIKEKLGRNFIQLAGQFSDKRIMVRDEETEVSTKEKFAFNGIYFQIAKDDRVPGWHRVKELLMPRPGGCVGFKVFNTCSEFIRVMPEMVYDSNNAEDMEHKNSECHIPDEFRYFAVMRKIASASFHDPEVITNFNPVTGYISGGRATTRLRDTVKRLPECKPGIDYCIRIGAVMEGDRK